MRLVLNDETHLEQLAAEDWAMYFTAWFDALVDALGAKHDKFDREDAVVQAFVKIMTRDGNCTNIPDTEKKLFGCILWQAKGALSHLYEKKDIEVRHATNAMTDGFLSSTTGTYCRIDREVMKDAAFATLHEVCESAGMKSRNIEAYCRCYLNCEPTALVATELGMTTNNIHQIKSRVEKLLIAKGRECYARHRQRLFREAA